MKTISEIGQTETGVVIFLLIGEKHASGIIEQLSHEELVILAATLGLKKNKGSGLPEREDVYLKKFLSPYWGWPEFKSLKR